ncbi:DUF3363 domain-containing protein [Bradyrhizobium sp. 38]|uniref:DUF3363 domain-containing protein n=1 Tax=unclassified Bradyrhizobium TaxID=2631580 RepID=UPI001FF953D0|nr:MULTISPECIES: DUF3363 domain-containing protein [unclassified Bradyrhizobium]MCK1334579.1 DUF3363 domain-containing protein [Bradyrhizobium sp. 38]MCK1410024.1 DUF3363 domain-containing protein [Bradyrhizobium sp. 76]MCK1479003.1 DUF3363 domain-containing protein [Bradyrhizobium sp. 197]MCK1775529.1 DUF3363 domain-containing protein [Bradyrhizobium sp. 132]UPJ59757.1 DUF3363 domain-containing protein [Bradyrhizobium sp. 192]
MRTLARRGLAEPAGPAVWVLAPDAEARLRALGERGDIISGCTKPSRGTAPAAPPHAGHWRRNSWRTNRWPSHRARA